MLYRFFFWSWLIMYMQFWKAFSFFSNDRSIKSNVWKIYHISKLCKNAVIITFKLKRNTTHLKELSKILNFNLFYYLVYSGNSITLNTHLMTWVNKQRIAFNSIETSFHMNASKQNTCIYTYHLTLMNKIRIFLLTGHCE